MKLLIITLVLQLCIISVLSLSLSDSSEKCKDYEVPIRDDEGKGRVCEPQCKDLREGVCKPCNPEDKIYGCVCEPGRARDDTGNCVLFENCCGDDDDSDSDDSDNNSDASNFSCKNC